MTVGIPGAGIGGLFYLAGSLWMPFREAWALLRGRSSPQRRSLAARQLFIALGILAAMWSTAWLIETVLRLSVSMGSGPGMGSPDHPDVPRILTYSALWIGVVTLIGVYVSTHVARLLVNPSAPSVQAGASGAPRPGTDLPYRRPERMEIGS